VTSRGPEGGEDRRETFEIVRVSAPGAIATERAKGGEREGPREGTHPQRLGVLHVRRHLRVEDPRGVLLDLPVDVREEQLVQVLAMRVVQPDAIVGGGGERRGARRAASVVVSPAFAHARAFEKIGGVRESVLRPPGEADAVTPATVCRSPRRATACCCVVHQAKVSRARTAAPVVGRAPARGSKIPNPFLGPAESARPTLPPRARDDDAGHDRPPRLDPARVRAG
jgi:hypothetical protein